MAINESYIYIIYILIYNIIMRYIMCIIASCINWHYTANQLVNTNLNIS